MTSQKLNEEYEILRRFVAVVVSSAFKNSLTVIGGRKTAQEKKQIPGNGGSQELFGPMFP